MTRLWQALFFTLWFAIFGILPIAPAWSQAALLPNAKQTFVDSNGNPLSGGKVYTTVPGTAINKTTWQDSTQSTANTNPITLDGAGRAVIYGQGSYQQRVTNSTGDTQWDALTEAYGSSSPSGATGTDTAPVGTVMPWAGFTAPTNWQFAYGQAVNRTTYDDLLTAITISDDSISCASGSAVLSGWPSTSQMRVGAPVEASCVATGTTIVSITSSTSITVSNNATATATITAVVFPWGNGDGVTTFNIPDLRGNVLAGPDSMGGTAASRLSKTTTLGTTSGLAVATVASATGVAEGMTIVSANVPAGTTVSQLNGTTVTMSNNATATASGTAVTFLAFSSANAPASSGGGYYHILTVPELPNATLSTTIAASQGTHSHPGLGGVNFITGSGATLSANAAGGAWGATATTGNASLPAMSGTTPTGGTASPWLTIQPSLSINFIVKMAPNTTGAGGVVSIGGLFGDIAVDSTLQAYTSGSINYLGCTSAAVGQVGCVEPDGITTVISGGKLVAIAGVASSIGVGTTAITSGTSGRILYDNAGVVGEVATTGSGSVVLALTPTLVAPDLGTPSAAILTNATGLPISTGVAGLGVNVAAFLATSSSANLLAALTDETGDGSAVFALTPTITSPTVLGHPTVEGVTSTGATGAGKFVFDTSPTLVTPDLGTPSAVTLTNATGLPVSTGISGLGTNVATFLGTPSSANLAAALTDETGSPGAAVFSLTPTITSPTVLGHPTIESVTSTGATGTGKFVFDTSPNMSNPVITGSFTATGLVNNSDLANSTVTIGSESVALGATLAALTGRGSTALNIDQCTSTGDADYTIQVTDRCVYHTALSTARTDTLPAASAVNAGQVFYLLDMAGVALTPTILTLQRSGSDTVNGGTTYTAITSQYGTAQCWSDGSSAWNCSQPGSGGGGSGTMTQVTPGSGLVSSVSSSCSQGVITTSGTLSGAQCLNAQTGTTYTFVNGDRAKLVTAANASAQAYTLPQAGASNEFQSGWYVDVRNVSTVLAGVVTVTPATSTINGAASLVLYPGQSARIVSDGINYQLGNTGSPKAGIVTATRDVSAADGNVSYTGLGFRPTMCFGLAALNTNTFPAWGMAASNGSGIGMGSYSSTAYAALDNFFTIYATTATNRTRADIVSFDSDGFTLSWTKTNSPTGTANLKFMCVQ